MQHSTTALGDLGIVGHEATSLATGIYGVVKFVSILLFAVVIVEFVGRDSRIGPESACRS
ncbi:hypothetical protein N7451_012871 [Penicillium sp. IBT 35674x]|nr:hypothetical protein N7451_012871 [Penicillium sp. IBT 35674x]